MKHSLELSSVDEHEIHSVEEIWTRGIFPFLSQEPIVQSFPLYLVSKRWGRWIYMLELYVTTDSPKGNTSYASLAERIGPSTKSLETVPAMMAHIHNFTKLEKLVFVDNGWITISNSLECISTTLTSLTIAVDMNIPDIKKLINLKHLSILCINNWNWQSFDISSLKKIERLHVAREYSRCGVDNVDIHTYHIPRSKDAVKLKYLECDSITVFDNISYNGRGKWLNRATGWKEMPYYDGEWLEGKRHGNGVYKSVGFSCEGEWVDGFISKGIITLDIGKYVGIYEGELLDELFHIEAHGMGKLVVGKTVYNGQFERGKFIPEEEVWPVAPFVTSK